MPSLLIFFFSSLLHCNLKLSFFLAPATTMHSPAASLSALWWDLLLTRMSALAF